MDNIINVSDLPKKKQGKNNEKVYWKKFIGKS